MVTECLLTHYFFNTWLAFWGLAAGMHFWFAFILSWLNLVVLPPNDLFFCFFLFSASSTVKFHCWTKWSVECISVLVLIINIFTSRVLGILASLRLKGNLICFPLPSSFGKRFYILYMNAPILFTILKKILIWINVFDFFSCLF